MGEAQSGALPEERKTREARDKAFALQDIIKDEEQCARNG